MASGDLVELINWGIGNQGLAVPITPGDAQGNTSGIPMVAGLGMIWDPVNSQWRRWRGDTKKQSYDGLVNSAPAVNTQATATLAAAGAGISWLCDSITASLSSTAAVAVRVNLVLRDGASGVGAIIWITSTNIPATANVIDRIVITGLGIKGTANTAMTLEFTAAGGANTFENLVLGAYKVNI